MVAVVANPVKFAVMVPAVKSPLISRATMADAVLASVAVVAELSTFPAVVIVANFVSAIAAEALRSASTISPSFIFTEVTALTAISGDAAEPVKSPANWIFPLVFASASGAPEETLESI